MSSPAARNTRQLARDAKPTDGAYKVFEELSRELEGHLTTLEGLLGQELESVNSKLKSEGMEPVTRTPN